MRLLKRFLGANRRPRFNQSGGSRLHELNYTRKIEDDWADHGFLVDSVKG